MNPWDTSTTDARLSGLKPPALRINRIRDKRGISIKHVTRPG